MCRESVKNNRPHLENKNKSRFILYSTRFALPLQRINLNRNDQVHQKGGDLECNIARRGNPAGRGVRRNLPGVVFPER